MNRRAPAPVTRLAVRVMPRASRNKLRGWDGNTLTVAVTAPPADGQANIMLVKLLARVLAVPRSAVTIASGAASRAKLVDVHGLTLEEISTRIEQSDDN